MVKINLQAIQNEISNPANPAKIIESVAFLEKLTQIESESDGNYFGKFSPTKNDFIQWEKWFSINKNNLCVDPKSNTVYLKN